MNPKAIRCACVILVLSAASGYSSDASTAVAVAKPPNPIDVPGDPRIEIKPSPLPGARVGRDATTPPPRIEVPGDPVTCDKPIDTATLKIGDEKKARLASRHESWRKALGADEFHPFLSIVNGRPILMLTTSSEESDATQAKRLRAALTACEFMLLDDAFETATICIATIDKRNPSVVETRNSNIARGSFRSEISKTGKNAEYQSALATAQADDTSVRTVCAALGLK